MAPVVAGAAVIVVVGVAGLMMSRGARTAPPPAPAPSADTAPPAPTAATLVEAALGDSVVIGHGADAAVRVAGKAPRVVTPDAVALIQLSLAKPRFAVGDTVHLRVEAVDDEGKRVTTPQIVQATSNPRVVKFAAPGELVGVKAGRATITVSAGTTTARHEVTVAAKSAPAAKKARR